MPWDVETARTYLGEPADPPSDDAIQTVLDYTLDSIEERLGRNLFREQATEKWYEIGSNGVVLAKRYPVESVETLDGEVVPSDVNIQIRSLSGVMESDQFVCKDTLQLGYTGGYDDAKTGDEGTFPWPPALERTMWECFIEAWNGSDPATGLPPATGGGGISTGTGEVKTLTVFDAFRIDYDLDSTSTGDSTGADDVALWGWLAPWANVLAFYRSGPYGTELGIA